MFYESVIDKMWIKFINGQKAPSRATFDQINETFRQEEEGHSSEHVPLEIKSYLAERRIWRYYFGEGIPFPGIHPALRRGGYTPQFGWNQETGEPWFAIKCYAREAFPALCGPRGVFLNDLHQLTQKFTLRCERFEDEGYVLLWPEFNNRSDINVPRFRDQFNHFQACLREWTSRGGTWSRGDRRERIDIAYQEFINRQDYASRILPLPEGFDFGFAFQ